MAKYVTQGALETFWGGIKEKLRLKADERNRIQIIHDSENEGLIIATVSSKEGSDESE